MITNELKKAFIKDLTKLKEEISLYTDEALLWKIEKGIANPAGNLCLHLVGNLNHFIGATMGHTGFVRQRDAEFSLKNVPQSQLLDMIEQTISVIEQVLSKTTDAQLLEDYPLVVFKEKMTTGYFLIHLASHLGYHLGQINYHRRLVAFQS
ncbi:MAG: DinB family protein [Bacteroidetes bacterium]|nr:DinB family protein [Bacteroidota bacterium]MBS1539262.1 DinB family protein [Bacteroidota bacterium]